MGIDAGLAWREVSHGSVVYADRGITSGMQYGINRAEERGVSVEIRYTINSVLPTRKTTGNGQPLSETFEISIRGK